MKETKKTFMAMAAILFAGLIFMGCPVDDNHKDNTPGADPLEGKLLILQAYGTGDETDGAVSHSFVELYNNTDTAINLAGYSLQYAAGTTVSSGQTNTAAEDGDWTIINLVGSIPAKGSFLILGKKMNLSGRFQIADNFGDINNDMQLSNRAFKAALINSATKLIVQNPFNTDGNGKKVSGYIDMIGAANDYQGRDLIFGFETAPARISKQAAVRRISLTGANNNQIDFESVDYRVTGITNEVLEVKKPRNSGAGTWDPLAEPEQSVTGLMILQVYGIGTTSGDNTAGTHSFIELYNNSDTPINLSAFSVHYADGTASGKTTVDSWTKINLTGAIPAKGSYLILGKQMRQESEITSEIGRLNFISTTPDLQVETFTLSNRSWKVALISNQNVLTEPDPWEKDLGCLDIVSAINTVSTDTIDAAKGAIDLNAINTTGGGARTISKQKSFRRTSLTVSNVTLTDFTSKQYSTISEDDIAKFRPRTTVNGSYAPVF